MPTFHTDITIPTGSPVTIMATNETWIGHSEPESQQQSKKMASHNIPREETQECTVSRKDHGYCILG